MEKKEIPTQSWNECKLALSLCRTEKLFLQIWKGSASCPKYLTADEAEGTESEYERHLRAAHCNIIHNRHDMKWNHAFQGMHEKECIYVTEYYSAISKNRVRRLALKWMEVETIMINNISQTKK